MSEMDMDMFENPKGIYLSIFQIRFSRYELSEGRFL